MFNFRIYVISILVILSCLIIPEQLGNAYFSKEEFSKEMYIEWMYKNTRLERRSKINKVVLKKELTRIYERIDKERFSYVKLSLMKTESAFDNSAIGKSKERCLMQVNPIWTKELKERKKNRLKAELEELEKGANSSQD